MYAVISNKVDGKYIPEGGFSVANISDAVDAAAPFFPGSKQQLLDELEQSGIAHSIVEEFVQEEFVRVEVFEDDLHTNPVDSMVTFLSKETMNEIGVPSGNRFAVIFSRSKITVNNTFGTFHSAQMRAEWMTRRYLIPFEVAEVAELDSLRKQISAIEKEI